jgi:hypothetical protein
LPKSRYFDDDDLALRRIEAEIDARVAARADAWPDPIDDALAALVEAETENNVVSPACEPVALEAKVRQHPVPAPDVEPSKPASIDKLDATLTLLEIEADQPENLVEGTCTADVKPVVPVEDVSSLTDEEINAISSRIEFDNAINDALDPTRELRRMVRAKIEQAEADRRENDRALDQEAVEHKRKLATLRKRRERAKQPKKPKRSVMLARVIPEHDKFKRTAMFRSLKLWVEVETGARVGQLRAEYHRDGDKRLRELVRFAEHYSWFIEANGEPPSDREMATKLRWKPRKIQSTRDLVTELCRPGGPWA